MPWVVLDEGCQECGVETIFHGVYRTKEAADAKVAAIYAEFKGWRDGGQAGASAYEWNGAFSDESVSNLVKE